jgi:hypothetical protein
VPEVPQPAGKDTEQQLLEANRRDRLMWDEAERLDRRWVAQPYTALLWGNGKRHASVW